MYLSYITLLKQEYRFQSYLDLSSPVKLFIDAGFKVGNLYQYELGEGVWLE
jgi:hypothetical protein